MKRFSYLILCLIFHQILAEEIGGLPLKNNAVSNFVNQTLNKIFEEISKTNLSIGEMNLGEDVGRFFEVEGCVLGKLMKKVDGVGSWGFILDANATDIAVGGKYDLVHLDVPLLFPFFGKGRFSILLGMASVGMELKASYNFAQATFDVEIPKFDVVVRNSKVQFDDLMNDAHLADFLNELISNLIPDVVTMLTPPILEIVNPTIAEIANGILLCIKKELTSGKIEECIRNLFQKMPTFTKLYESITEKLIEEFNKF